MSRDPTGKTGRQPGPLVWTVVAAAFALALFWPRGGGGSTIMIAGSKECPPCTTGARCYPPAKSPQRKGWTREIAKHSSAKYSQRGQDGVLEYIFQNIGTTNKFFVEFGYNTKELVGASGPNTAALRDRGWTGLLLDGGNSNPAINLHAHFLCSSNIVDIFELRKVPESPDYVSIDIDGYDPWIMLELMRSHKFRPRVISAEFNVAFPRDSPFVMANWGKCETDGRSWGMTRLNSASPGVLARMGASAGYTLVHVEGDAFFVRSDQLEDAPFQLNDLPALKPNDAGCFNAEWEKKIDKDMAKLVWDFDTWAETGSAEKAAAAARAMVEAAEKKCGFQLAEPGAFGP